MRRLSNNNNNNNVSSENDAIPSSSPHASTQRLINLIGSSWARRTYSYKCMVDEGAQPLRRTDMQEMAQVASQRPPRIAFEGECYACGTSGHSQNYCPLKRCETCLHFGHAEKVCMFRRKSVGNGLNDRRVSRRTSRNMSAGSSYHRRYGSPPPPQPSMETLSVHSPPPPPPPILTTPLRPAVRLTAPTYSSVLTAPAPKLQPPNATAAVPVDPVTTTVFPRRRNNRIM